MSHTQLPSVSEEENTVVERFVERSREFVPGVEVTLAKRIVRPGSNKILCMAARTSVPLNEDEMASVSDLALRLSDGTNVVLSLSFFNEVAGGQFIPLGPSWYDPERYSLRSESQLGQVILAISMFLLVGFYSMLHGPLASHIHMQFPFMLTGASSIPRKIDSTGYRDLQSKTPAGHITKAIEKTKLFKTSRISKSINKLLSSKGARTSRTPQVSFLVPPPPPVAYSLPYTPTSLPFEQLSPAVMSKNNSTMGARNTVNALPKLSQFEPNLERIPAATNGSSSVTTHIPSFTPTTAPLPGCNSTTY